MDYDGNGTLYHLTCGICGRLFWSHDGFASVCDECKGSETQTDMVNVVRCKDCKHCFIDGGNVKFNVCELNHNRVQSGNWFCADGERKEGR